MIVVVAERAFDLAEAAAAAGGAVQLVTTVPEGAEGDASILGLARAGVGHAAVVRRTDGALEAADVALALRYLPEIRVVVLGGVPEALVPPSVEAAAWADASLVVVVGADATPPAGLPDSAIVLAAPAWGTARAGGFASFVGRLAAALDAGEGRIAALEIAGAAVAADRVG